MRNVVQITFMKTAFTVVALSLLLFGCGCGDARLQKEVVGNWMRDNYFKMTLYPNGSFISHWASTNRTLTFEGTWKIQDGCMVTTLSNCTAVGTTDFERVGSVDRYVIIRADSTGLVYSNNNQIISFIRE